MEFLRSLDPRALDPMTLVAALALFVLVLVLWSAVILLWIQLRARQRVRILRRLEGGSARNEETRVLRLWHEGKEHFTTVAASGRRSSSLKSRPLTIG